jgi:hypothetical protein
MELLDGEAVFTGSIDQFQRSYLGIEESMDGGDIMHDLTFETVGISFDFSDGMRIRDVSFPLGSGF